jgi:hypothetical protein
MSFTAEVGDRVAVESHRLRGGRRTGEIVEVLGSPEHEYYRVRWEDGHESSFHPGNDAVLLTRGRRRRSQGRPAPAEAGSPDTSAAEPSPAPRTRRKPARPRIAAGDRLVIRGHHLGERDRDAEILEVLGEDGGPPYRVRWSETGRETLLYPGSDAVVEHFRRRGRRPPAG